MWYWIIGAALGLIIVLVFCRVQLHDHKMSPLKKKLIAIWPAPVIFLVLLLVGVPLLIVGICVLGYLFFRGKLKRRRAATAPPPMPESPVP